MTTFWQTFKNISNLALKLAILSFVVLHLSHIDTIKTAFHHCLAMPWSLSQQSVVTFKETLDMIMIIRFFPLHFWSCACNLLIWSIVFLCISVFLCIVSMVLNMDFLRRGSFLEVPFSLFSVFTPIYPFLSKNTSLSCPQFHYNVSRAEPLVSVGSVVNTVELSCMRAACQNLPSHWTQDEKNKTCTLICASYLLWTLF